jgi:hypothetical protein
VDYIFGTCIELDGDTNPASALGYVKKRVALCRKCVPNPLDVLGFPSHFGHGDHIEAHAEAGQIAVLLKEPGCCPNEADLLAPADASRRPTELIAGSGPHLDNDQHIPLTRDDIQLAQAPAEVTFEDFETLGP